MVSGLAERQSRWLWPAVQLFLKRISVFAKFADDQESLEFSVGGSGIDVDEANRVAVVVNRICDEEDIEFRSLNASIVDSFASRGSLPEVV